MAVIDRDKVLATSVHVAERAELLARIDQVARGRRLVRIRAADRARRRTVPSGDEPACFVRRGLARVRDDLVTDRAWQREGVGYAPPAIAGMTMTSAPSGTLAAVPPAARASSSPMYTFT